MMAQTFTEKAWFSPINVLRTENPCVRCAPSPFQGQELIQLCRKSTRTPGSCQPPRRFNKPVTPQEGPGPGWDSLATLAAVWHPPSFVLTPDHRSSQAAICLNRSSRRSICHRAGWLVGGWGAWVQQEHFYFPVWRGFSPFGRGLSAFSDLLPRDRCFCSIAHSLLRLQAIATTISFRFWIQFHGSGPWLS